jgi:bacterioferritin
MKTTPQIITMLNSLLMSERTAIAQYMGEYAILQVQGYKELVESWQERAHDEMKHAAKLAKRIALYGGMPDMQKINAVKASSVIGDMITNDLSLERAAVAEYNAAIKQATTAGDDDLAHFLRHRLRDEVEHVESLEAYATQIEQVGLENWLSGFVEA